MQYYPVCSETDGRIFLTRLMRTGRAAAVFALAFLEHAGGLAPTSPAVPMGNTHVVPAPVSRPRYGSLPLAQGPVRLRATPRRSCVLQAVGGALPIEPDESPDAHTFDEGSYVAPTTTGDYLESLSRVADDGRLLSKAPQRYSSKDWVHNLVTIRNDVVFAAVRAQLLCQVSWALLVSLVYIRFARIPALPALPHSLLGGVIGVLLGFRTNQSYDRFWEGRKLWALVFEKCRSMARISLACIDANAEVYYAVLRHLKAFPIALKQHLRGEYEISEFRGTLAGPELNELASGDNLPLTVCTSLSMALNKIKLDSSQSGNLMLWWVLEAELSKLAAVVADCERLVRTPVPLAYAVHTSRLLSLWTGTLPFVLVGCFQGWLRLLTAPVIALVGYALFCTEELGHMIEEPFGAQADRPEVLPLRRYCKAIMADLEDKSNLRRRALHQMEEARIEKAQAAVLNAEAEAEALLHETEQAKRIMEKLSAAALEKMSKEEIDEAATSTEPAESPELRRENAGLKTEEGKTGLTGGTDLPTEGQKMDLENDVKPLDELHRGASPPQGLGSFCPTDVNGVVVTGVETSPDFKNASLTGNSTPHY